MRNDDDMLPAGSELSVAHADGQTRAAVVGILVEEGPLTAGEVAERLGISAAGVRRHLEALVTSGDVTPAPPVLGRASRAPRGRGRPAKRFQLTVTGRGKLRHAYDDLAGAAMRRLRDLGGSAAVETFARERVEGIVAGVRPSADADTLPETVEDITDALTSAGYAANTRAVGSGVQICQHHCPVAHVAAEFPELCEAETAVFSELLGTHVQRLATIANGDCACTTHVPLAEPVSTTEHAVRNKHAVPTEHGTTPTARDAQPASAAAPTSRKVSR